jgi:hypothetical protein
MGCACVKSDVVVKNKKTENKNIDNVLEKKASAIGMANESRKTNITNERNNNLINHQRNQNNNNALNTINNHRNSNANLRSTSIRQNMNYNIPENIMNDRSNNLFQGSIPYLPSSNDPNFNFPEICNN